MEFIFDEAVGILSRTPFTLNAMLRNLPEEWIICNEGKGTWSAFDIVGHLVDGERNDWMTRVKLIKSNRNETFQPIDRFEHLERNKNCTLEELLDEFNLIRNMNLKNLRNTIDCDEDLLLSGIHPSFGEVSMKQLLSTWVVHDLNHISQISRVMGKRYQSEVGPWSEYLRILS